MFYVTKGLLKIVAGRLHKIAQFISVEIHDYCRTAVLDVGKLVIFVRHTHIKLQNLFLMYLVPESITLVIFVRHTFLF